MTHRRTFFKQAGTVAGAYGLTSLLGIREAFATELRAVPRVGEDAGALAVRDRYMLGPEVIYFNHASIGTIPRAVHAAHVGYLRVCESNPWLYMWGGEWERPREEVRTKAARALGCSPADLALTHNTTEGFNILANGLDLGPGDEVVFGSFNHDGASVCWQHNAAARGFSVTRFDFPALDVPRMTAEDVLDVYDRHITARTRVLVLPHIDNILGIRHPLRDIASLAHERGVDIVAVDGAQSVGMIDMQLSETGVDVYCGSPHKWVQAPKGVGVMFMSEATRERVRPMWVTWGQRRWEGTVRVFEDYGTRNLPELMALGDALDFQAQLGAAAKEARYHELWSRFQRATDGAPHTTWRSPRDWALSSSLYGVEINGKASSEVAQKLNRDHGFVFRAFGTQGLNTVRLSPNVYTTDEEIQMFFDVTARL